MSSAERPMDRFSARVEGLRVLKRWRCGALLLVAAVAIASCGSGSADDADADPNGDLSIRVCQSFDPGPAYHRSVASTATTAGEQARALRLGGVDSRTSRDL